MNIFIQLILGLCVGLLYGALFLILSSVLLPERIFRKIMKKLKPDYVSNAIVMRRLSLIFEFLFNSKEVLFNDATVGASKDLQEEIASLIREKRILEGNLFFLDLLKNLSSMIVFSLLREGFKESSVCGILIQSIEYLQNYSRQLKPSRTCANIEERVFNATEILSIGILDTKNFLATPDGVKATELVLNSIKQKANIFDDLMKGEYESTKENLTRNNQLLAEKFILFMENIE